MDKKNCSNRVKESSSHHHDDDDDDNINNNNNLGVEDVSATIEEWERRRPTFSLRLPQAVIEEDLKLFNIDTSRPSTKRPRELQISQDRFFAGHSLGTSASASAGNMDVKIKKEKADDDIHHNTRNVGVKVEANADDDIHHKIRNVRVKAEPFDDEMMNDNYFNCDQCPMRFPTLPALQIHKASAHGHGNDHSDFGPHDDKSSVKLFTAANP